MKHIEAVYIAGKMEDDMWRHQFFDAYDAPEDHMYQLQWNPLTIGSGDPWPTKSEVTVCGLTYTGPFFVDVYGGHGYGYIDGEAHGSNVEKAGYYERVEDLEEKRNQVQQWCFRAIQRADLVFAWIDGIDCYGTIAEIGYAKAMGKLIWIASPRRYDDLWFVYCMADETVFISQQHESAVPAEIFRNLLHEYRRVHRHFDSPIEQAFWDAWVAAARRDPFFQFEVDLVPQHPIGRYRVDFAHPASKTAIELDGHATHSSPDAIAYDRKRQRALEDSGWHVIRFGGKEVSVDAPACVAEVQKVLAKRIDRMNALSAYNPQFNPGDKVRHPIFGDGVVIRGEDIEGLIEVQFKDDRKRLAPEFAKLEKLPF